MTPLRILIVDDNRDSADMLATLLKFSGHETHTAHDGMAAVEAAIKLIRTSSCWTLAYLSSTAMKRLVEFVKRTVAGAVRCSWP